MVFAREESSVPASYIAAIEGGSMDSGSNDEVLEIALLTVLFHKGRKGGDRKER